jgi:hypothetical protein
MISFIPELKIHGNSGGKGLELHEVEPSGLIVLDNEIPNLVDYKKHISFPCCGPCL